MSEPEKSKKPRIKTVPGIVFEDGRILEQCWDSTKAFFWLYDPHALSERDTLRDYDQYKDENTGIIYSPIQNEYLKDGFVLLPNYPAVYGNEAQLLNEIQGLIHDYCELEPDKEMLLAMYVLTSWIYDKCPAISIINLRGGAGTGKSRVLHTLRHICFRGINASGCTTVSALFRTVDQWRGTLCMDEGDLNHSNESNEIVRMLNLGVMKDGIVVRINPNSPTFETNTFRVFGPKILTTRQQFSDNALESRCLIIPMKERIRTNIPVHFPPEFYDRAYDLRNKLLQFRINHFGGFANDNWLEYRSLSSRMNQILQPLASLAKMIGGVFFSKIEEIAIELQDRIIEASAESVDGQIVRAYLDLEEKGDNDSKVGRSSTEISEQIAKNGGDVKANVIGRRMGGLGFSLKKGAKKREWYLPDDHQRESLIRRFVPQERLSKPSSSDTSDTNDGIGGRQQTFVEVGDP
jgi:hypothetical protein